MSERSHLLQETIDARDKAAALLKALLEAKGVTDAQPPSPKGDLYKRVTGTSSMENAIAEARRAVDTYERLIAQLERDAGEAEVVVKNTGRLAGGAASK